MIESMKKYTFLVLASQYDTFLEKVREAGVVHVTLKAEGIADDEQLRQTIAEAEAKKKLIEAGAPEQLLQEKSSVLAKLDATRKEAERMAIWGSYSHERLDAIRAAGYSLTFFTCPKKAFKEEWGSVVAEDGSTLYCVAVVPAGEEFELPQACAEQVLNEKTADELNADAEALKGLLAASEARIEAWGKANLRKVQNELDELRQNIDWQKVQLSSDTMADGALRLMEGFCPAEKADELNKVLAEQDVYYEIEDPKVDDATPILLKNNFFTRLFEPITRLYSLPNYAELDPTPFFAPFFMLFFGLCLGDGGYGLLILLAGLGVILKAPKFKEWGWLGIFMGLTTMVVGILTGVFFGVNLEEVAVLAPVKQYFITETNATVHFLGGSYHPMMVFAILIGIFQILFGMGFKVVKITLCDGFKYAAYDCAWLVALVTLIVWFALAGSLSTVGLYIIYAVLGICALFIMFYSNPDKKILLVNIGGGLWGTYNMVSGLLGDILSYIRLFALGLAGGILGNVFNTLALQAGGAMPSWIGWLPALLIMVFGHSLNFALCLISSIVHPMRLTFVEFYKNAGFEGGGKEYTPFKK